MRDVGHGRMLLRSSMGTSHPTSRPCRLQWWLLLLLLLLLPAPVRLALLCHLANVRDGSDAPEGQPLHPADDPLDAQHCYRVRVPLGGRGLGISPCMGRWATGFGLHSATAASVVALSALLEASRPCGRLARQLRPPLAILLRPRSRAVTTALALLFHTGWRWRWGQGRQTGCDHLLRPPAACLPLLRCCCLEAPLLLQMCVCVCYYTVRCVRTRAHGTSSRMAWG